MNVIINSGSDIKRFREFLKVSREQMATDLHMSPRGIQAWELTKDIDLTIRVKEMVTNYLKEKSWNSDLLPQDDTEATLIEKSNILYNKRLSDKPSEISTASNFNIPLESENKMTNIIDKTLQGYLNEKVANNGLDIDHINVYVWSPYEKKYTRKAGAKTSRNETSIDDAGLIKFNQLLAPLEAILPMKEKTRNRYSTPEIQILYFKITVGSEIKQMTCLVVCASKFFDPRFAPTFNQAVDMIVQNDWELLKDLIPKHLNSND